MNHQCCPLSPCPTARCCNADPAYVLREPARPDLHTSWAVGTEPGGEEPRAGEQGSTQGRAAATLLPDPPRLTRNPPALSCFSCCRYPHSGTSGTASGEFFQRLKDLLPLYPIYSETMKGLLELWVLKRL